MKKVFVILLSLCFLAQVSGLVSYVLSGGKSVTYLMSSVPVEDENQDASTFALNEDLICGSDFSLIRNAPNANELLYVDHFYREPEASLIFLSTFSPPPERA